MEECNLKELQKDSAPIVISGISGFFPSCENVEEFKANLYNAVDMTEEIPKDWASALPDIPNKMGKLKCKSKFDAGFFGISHRQTQTMDPMGRILLEKTYEAILDAGIHPAELQDSKTGVFIGSLYSDSEMHCREVLEKKSFGILCCSRSTLAKRISYHFKFSGPSYALDSACSTSIYALEQAINLIKRGDIDSAVVGGANLILNPMVTLQFTGLGALSADGKCKPFDEAANGYVRAESLVVIFIQRAKSARRLYAEVLNVKTNCDGFKDQSITFPSEDGQKQLLREFYNDCGVDPNDISYVEAHGTGTQAGDPVELNSIDHVLCTHRSKPLLIGSLKSNMGHGEPVSGLSSIVKMIISMESGVIPPTLNYKNSRKIIQALQQGRMQVVNEKMLWPSRKILAGVNSFGFGGANGHVLLRAHGKQKTLNGACNYDLPRLVCVGSRTREGIEMMLDKIRENPLDVEFMTLLHYIFRYPTEGHLYRGFSIVHANAEIKHSIVCIDEVKPLCVIFGPPSKNWSKMGTTLLKIAVFNKFIQKIQDICNHLNLPVNIVDLILETDESTNYYILSSVAIQIALFNLLKSLNIACKSVVGYSLGAIAAACVQQELTLEQTILTAFYASAITDEESNVLKNNNEESLLELLPNPIKTKLNVWFSSKASTSIFGRIPQDALLVEIGETVDSNLGNITKIKLFDYRSCTIESLLESLGRIYEHGHGINLINLYPNIALPVSCGTPMISPLIQWKHRQDWFLMKYQAESSSDNYHRIITINLREKEWEYLSGHVIDGRILFPASGYLYLAWDTLAVAKGKPKYNMKYITFKHVKYITAVALHDDKDTQLTVLIQKSTGHFKVKEAGNVVSSGYIFETESCELLKNIPSLNDTNADFLPLTTKDIYKEFNIRNYNYDGQFQSIQKCNNEITKAVVEWKGNFVAFLDAMIHFPLLQVDTRSLRVPVSIEQLIIDVPNQTRLIENAISLQYYVKAGIICSEFIEMRNMNANSITKRKQLNPVLKSYQFIPNVTELDIKDSLQVCLQIVIENTTGLKMKIVEVLTDDSAPLASQLNVLLKELPLVQPEIKLFTDKAFNIEEVLVQDKSLAAESGCTLVIASNLSEIDYLRDQAMEAVGAGGFLISKEDLNFSFSFPQLEIIAVHTTKSQKLVLLRKIQPRAVKIHLDISQSVENFSWLTQLQDVLKKDSKIVLCSQGQPSNGILGLVNCLKQEIGAEKIQCIFDYDERSDSMNYFYAAQLNKGLVFNVWKDNHWGTYRYLLIDEHEQIESAYRYISFTKPGDLSSAKWLQGPYLQEGSQKLVVNVHYAALNAKDVMISTGKLPTDVIKGNKEHSYNPGFEFSGLDEDNNRVMGLVDHSALSNIVIANPETLWKIPDHWSLEDAATIPLVYSTVLYALVMVAKIQKGQVIMIHSGAGGIGQAAINISLNYGLTVFTTVGTENKREYIKKQFPQLGDSHIGYSRDTSFEELIMSQTKGKGVNVILNSHAEKYIETSLRCLAPRGHFLELGRTNIDKNNKLGLKIFTGGSSFHGIVMDKCLEDEEKRNQLSNLLKEAIEKGIVKPLQRRVFSSDEIIDAFKLMSSGQHMGKILIKRYISSSPDERLRKCHPRYSCDAMGTYVIIGGLGGFGMELSNWLVNRGCRKLVLTSRIGVTNGYQHMRIRSWKSIGVNIKILTYDVTTNSGCQKILNIANEMGPVYAIFNLAVVLKDALIENQTVENFQISFAPKVLGTLRLDALSRNLCPDLKDFVIFSSVVSGFGNTGQTNYGMANSVMERICELRRKDHLPALAIQWGAIGNVGILVERQNTPQVVGGTWQQSITSCLKVLDRIMKRNEVIICSMVVAEKTETQDQNISVKEAVAKVLGIRNMKTISPASTLPQLGLDSIMVVDVKEKLERFFGVHLTLQEIRKLKFGDLDKCQ